MSNGPIPGWDPKAGGGRSGLRVAIPLIALALIAAFIVNRLVGG